LPSDNFEVKSRIHTNAPNKDQLNSKFLNPYIVNTSFEDYEGAYDYEYSFYDST
jgi:hypothetical protein